MANRSDDFNRANGSLGTPSDGGSAWVLHAGTWGVASNECQKSANDTTFEIATLEASSTQVEVQATLVVQANDGLVVRAADNNNFIMGQVTSGTLAIYKRVAGTFTQIGTNYSGTTSNGDVYKLTVDASNLISFYQNGTLRKSGTDSAGSSNTKHGLMMRGISSRWDNFSITDTAGAAAASLIYCQPAIGPLLVR